MISSECENSADHAIYAHQKSLHHISWRFGFPMQVRSLISLEVHEKSWHWQSTSLWWKMRATCPNWESWEMLSYVYTSMFPLHCLLNNSLFARRHPIIEPRCADAAADLRDTSSENFELRKNVETFSDVIIAEVLTQCLVLNLTQSTMSCLYL